MKSKHLAIDKQALVDTLDQVQAYFMNEMEGGVTTLALHPESWAYVGLRTEWVLDMLDIVRSYFPKNSAPSFLECGSGLGFVASLAKGYGFRVLGIELNEDYLTYSRKIFPSVKVLQSHVMSFNQYHEFDVIYYYGPFKDQSLQRAFEHLIESNCKQGCIILCNRKASFDWERLDTFERLDAPESISSVSYIIRKK